MKKVNQDLKNNTLEKIYMICSEEHYILRDFKNKFISSFNSDDFNYFLFERDNFNDLEVKNCILSHSFFVEKKLIIFDNVNLSDNKNIEEFIDYIKSSFDTNVILILENEVPKKKKLVDFVKENGYFVEVKEQSRDILVKYITKKLNENKMQMSLSNVSYLLDKTNDNLSILNNELEKVICYSIGKSVIEKTDIDEIVSNTLEDKVYKMIENINKTDIKSVVSLYSELVALNVNPSSIISKIRYNYVQILKVKNLIDEGITIDAMLKRLNLKWKWQIDKIINIARKTDPEKILNKIRYILELDKERLSGNIDQKIALELIIFC